MVADSRIKVSVDTPALWAPSIQFLKFIARFICISAGIYLAVLIALAPEQIERAFAVAVLIPVAGLSLLLLARARVQPAIWLLGAGLWLQILTAACFLGGLESPAVSVLPLLIVALGWLVGVQAAFAVAALTAAATLALGYAEAEHLLPAALASHALLRWVLLAAVYTLAAIMIAYIVRSYRERLDEIRRYALELDARNRELQRREFELSHARNQLAGTLNAIPDLLLEIEGDGRVIDVHTNRMDLLEMPVQAFVGKTLREILPENASRVCADAIAEAREKGYAQGQQFELERPRGRISVELSVSRKPTGAEGPLRYIVLARDVSRRASAERSLRAQGAQLQSILGATADGILAVDRRGKVLHMNQRFAELWGLPQATLEIKEHQALEEPARRPLDAPEASPAAEREIYVSNDVITDSVHFEDGRVYERYSAPLLQAGANVGRVWSFRDISERRKAEAALLESRNLLRAVIDTAPVRVFWKDCDLRYLGCNPAFAKDAGKSTPEEVLGSDDFHLAWADVALRYREDDRKVMESGRARLGYEEPQTTPDGRERWLRTSKVPLKNDRDEIIGVLGVYEDITERRRAEQRLSMAIDITGVVFWELDLRSQQLIYDVANLASLGLDSDDAPMTITSWMERIHADDRAEFAAQFERALQPDNPIFEFEYRLRGGDGNYQWLRSLGQVIQRDAAGRPYYAVGTSTNITRRKQIEEAMRASEARNRELASMLRRICDNVPDLIWAKDLEGRYMFVNKAMCEQLLHAADTEEPVGRTHAYFAQRERAAHAHRPLWHTFGEQCADSDALTLARGCEAEYEEFGNVRGKMLVLNVRKAPFYDESGNIVGTVGTARDITESKRIEQLQRQSQKLEALGTLAGGIAHDFNNIVAAIKGNAMLAAQELGPDIPAAEYLSEIGKSADRAGELVRRILAFGRPGPVQKAVVDLNAVLDDVLKLLRPTLGASISLRVEIDDRPHRVLAEAAQVHEVVVNLTANAAYAIGARRGEIVYRLESVAVDAALSLQLADLEPGRYVRLSVSDDGCGMEAEVMERVFDAFYTTKPPGEGVGLGLSMVHGIVKTHGGAVSVESTPGKGSTFALYFPESRGAPAAQPADTAPETRPSARRSLLFVDDEEALVLLAQRMLQRRGYDVRSFTDPSEALAAFRAQPQRYDALVTDLSMPQMTGFDLARSILELRPDLKVVLTTGYLRDADAALAREIGIQEVVLKPNTADELAAVLDKLLGSRDN